MAIFSHSNVNFAEGQLLTQHVDSTEGVGLECFDWVIHVIRRGGRRSQVVDLINCEETVSIISLSSFILYKTIANIQPLNIQISIYNFLFSVVYL